MQAEIITIGDEILIGQIVDTNSAWIAQQLNLIGFHVKQISSVSDSANHIIEALDEALHRADLVLITGGLGPTKDDLTKKTLARYFNSEMVFHQEQYKQVEEIFRKFGREVSEINRQQAEIPEKCTCIINLNGTAPGMWFEKDSKIIVSMPGVPYEMMAMMKNDIMPMISHHFLAPVIRHRTFLTQGVGESILSEWISEWEDNLPSHMKLAYLPSPGIVRLRISATGENQTELDEQIQNQADALYLLIGKHIFGEGSTSLSEIIHGLFKKHNLTLSLAESCTGGYISHLLTERSGASDFFKGSIVSYTNEVKTHLLDIDTSLIEKHSAVSEEVALSMARSVKAKFNTDFAVAVTGYAGPNDGPDGTPVGSVWIAIATPQNTEAKLFRYGANRERNITMASLSALNRLRRKFLEIYPN